MSKKHNVFISFHHEDQYYKKRFEELFSKISDILKSKAVMDNDIDESMSTDAIRGKIRDSFIRSATVTVVLVGQDTWKRKHVDWEISASIRKTKNNSRTGLIGILLPTHTDSLSEPLNSAREKETFEYEKYTIPPRLADNIDCGFAKLYDWNEDPEIVQEWIHEAYKRRDEKKLNPNNSRVNFSRNRKENQTSWE